MKEPHILFLDIDNTLLTTDLMLTSENDAAIRRALKEGHRIVICSGRPLPGILPVAKKLDLMGEGCYLVACNGALIYDCGRGESILEQNVPMDDVKLLFREAASRGLYIHTYDEHSVLVREQTAETEYYMDRIGISCRVIENLPDGLKKEPAKALLIDLTGPERLEEFRQDVAPLVAGRVSLFFSSKYLLECVREGISKGEAVRFLCDYLHIPLERSVAAGDSQNDIPMLRAAHVGCAVANATDACRAAADYIAERDCDHSAVAEIIDKFII